jgi:hypothetical protein
LTVKRSRSRLAIGGDGTTTPNLVALRRGYVRGTRCRVYIADMKVVRVEARNCFYYPDVVATNDASDAKTSTYKYFPQLIVELLPDLTKVFDRRRQVHGLTQDVTPESPPTAE